MKTLERIKRYEDSILGMYMHWPELVTSIPFEIKIFSKWQKVVMEIIRQLNSGIRPDLITVTDAFPEDKHMLFELGILAKDCPSSANYASYLSGLAEMVSDVEIFRDIQQASRLISEGQPVKQVFGNVVNTALIKLNANGVSKFEYTAREAMKAMVDKLELVYDERHSETPKLLTGINKLDEIVGSFQPTDLVVVGARPAVGKTALAVSLMLNMGFAGKNVGFISTEMAVEQIANRMAAQVSGLNARKYRDSSFHDHEWAAVTSATQKISELKIRINDKPEMTISEVIMRCRAWDMIERLDIVIIDYLTRIKPDKEYQSKNIEVGEITAQLKNIARALKIPVIVLAQLNRGSVTRADKTPTMADLRDSGIIEQEADCILLLHREDQDSGENQNFIIVEKNRHGEAGIDLLVNFDPVLMRWY